MAYAIQAGVRDIFYLEKGLPGQLRVEAEKADGNSKYA